MGKIINWKSAPNTLNLIIIFRAVKPESVTFTPSRIPPSRHEHPTAVII